MSAVFQVAYRVANRNIVVTSAKVAEEIFAFSSLVHFQGHMRLKVSEKENDTGCIFPVYIVFFICDCFCPFFFRIFKKSGSGIETPDRDYQHLLKSNTKGNNFRIMFYVCKM